MPSACSSFTSTLNDSGMPGSGRFCPFTIASYTRLRPFTSSDLTVRISCSDVRGAVRLERPHFHLSETLAAELRLAGERLLRDERVRSDAPRVDLVVHEVRELQHVDLADGDRRRERLAAAAVAQPDLAERRDARRGACSSTAAASTSASDFLPSMPASAGSS